MSQSLAFRLGRAAGWVGAQTVQRTAQAAERTGVVGREFVAGAKSQYGATSADIRAARAAYYARKAAELGGKAEPHPVPAPAPAVEVVAEVVAEDLRAASRRARATA